MPHSSRILRWERDRNYPLDLGRLPIPTLNRNRNRNRTPIQQPHTRYLIPHPHPPPFLSEAEDLRRVREDDHLARPALHPHLDLDMDMGMGMVQETNKRLNQWGRRRRKIGPDSTAPAQNVPTVQNAQRGKREVDREADLTPTRPMFQEERSDRLFLFPVDPWRGGLFMPFLQGRGQERGGGEGWGSRPLLGLIG